MTLAQQYDKDKNEVADMFCESDAVDEVLNDICGLRNKFTILHATVEGFGEILEDLIEQIEEYIHYEERLEYILSQIPDKVKALLV